MKSLGVNRVRLVAHSMGGLVCRELLTSPALYGGKGEGHDAFPGIDRLIMIATPNHGSELARYHLLGEWVDQLNRQLAGSKHHGNRPVIGDGWMITYNRDR